MKTKTLRTGKKTGKKVAAKKPRPRTPPGNMLEAHARITDLIAAAKKLAERTETLEAELGELRWAGRRCTEYFALVEKLLKERDQWKEMFLEQTAGNSNAQSYLMEAVQKANHLTGMVIKILNQERILGDRPHFELTGKLPDGSLYAKSYTDLLAELMASAPDDTLVAEALAERDRIRALELEPPTDAPGPA